jgi:hypothetical protein
MASGVPAVLACVARVSDSHPERCIRREIEAKRLWNAEPKERMSMRRGGGKVIAPITPCAIGSIQLGGWVHRFGLVFQRTTMAPDARFDTVNARFGRRSAFPSRAEAVRGTATPIGG